MNFQNENGIEEFYDLLNDPYEQNDLQGGPLTGIQSNARAELESELTIIRQ